MNPLTDIQRAIVKLAIIALVLGGATWAARNSGVKAGEASVQTKWDASERLHRIAETAARTKHDRDMETLRKKYISINLKVSQDHENELQTLRRERAADRAAIDRAGGLRISAAACNPTPATTEAASAGGRDEAGAGTIRLPYEVENSLWSLTDDADEVSAQLRSCQAWIRENGFYGPAPTESVQLLDRMIAAPNQTAEEPTP